MDIFRNKKRTVLSVADEFSQSPKSYKKKKNVPASPLTSKKELVYNCSDEEFSDSSSESQPSSLEDTESSGDDIPVHQASHKQRSLARRITRREKQREQLIKKRKEQNKISMDDFLNKQLEFHVWLEEEKHKIYKQMSSPRKEIYFRTFMKLWNKRKLPQKYYRGSEEIQSPKLAQTAATFNVFDEPDEFSHLTAIKRPKSKRLSVENGGFMYSPFSTFGKTPPRSQDRTGDGKENSTPIRPVSSFASPTVRLKMENHVSPVLELSEYQIPLNSVSIPVMSSNEDIKRNGGRLILPYSVTPLPWVTDSDTSSLKSDVTDDEDHPKMCMPMTTVVYALPRKTQNKNPLPQVKSATQPPPVPPKPRSGFYHYCSSVDSNSGYRVIDHRSAPDTISIGSDQSIESDTGLTRSHQDNRSVMSDPGHRNVYSDTISVKSFESDPGYSVVSHKPTADIRSVKSMSCSSCVVESDDDLPLPPPPEIPDALPPLPEVTSLLSETLLPPPAAPYLPQPPVVPSLVPESLPPLPIVPSLPPELLPPPPAVPFPPPEMLPPPPVVPYLIPESPRPMPLDVQSLPSNALPPPPEIISLHSETRPPPLGSPPLPHDILPPNTEITFHTRYSLLPPPPDNLLENLEEPFPAQHCLPPPPGMHSPPDHSLPPPPVMPSPPPISPPPLPALSHPCYVKDNLQEASFHSPSASLSKVKDVNSGLKVSLQKHEATDLISDSKRSALYTQDTTDQTYSSAAVTDRSTNIHKSSTANDQTYRSAAGTDQSASFHVPSAAIIQKARVGWCRTMAAKPYSSLTRSVSKVSLLQPMYSTPCVIMSGMGQMSEPGQRSQQCQTLDLEPAKPGQRSQPAQRGQSSKQAQQDQSSESCRREVNQHPITASSHTNCHEVKKSNVDINDGGVSKVVTHADGYVELDLFRVEISREKCEGQDNVSDTLGDHNATDGRGHRNTDKEAEGGVEPPGYAQLESVGTVCPVVDCSSSVTKDIGLHLVAMETNNLPIYAEIKRKSDHIDEGLDGISTGLSSVTDNMTLPAGMSVQMDSGLARPLDVLSGQTSRCVNIDTKRQKVDGPNVPDIDISPNVTTRRSRRRKTIRQGSITAVDSCPTMDELNLSGLADGGSDDQRLLTSTPCTNDDFTQTFTQISSRQEPDASYLMSYTGGKEDCTVGRHCTEDSGRKLQPLGQGQGFLPVKGRGYVPREGQGHPTMDRKGHAPMEGQGTSQGDRHAPLQEGRHQTLLMENQSVPLPGERPGPPPGERQGTGEYCTLYKINAVPVAMNSPPIVVRKQQLTSLGAQLPPRSSSATQQPHGSLSAVQQPQESSCARQQPLGSLSAPQLPLRSSSATQQPHGSSGATQQPKGSSSATQQPKGSSGATQQPKGSLSATQQPKGSSSATQQPHGSLSAVQQPQESSCARQPLGSLCAPQLPPRSSSATQQPKGSLSATQQPKGSLSATQQPQGSSSATQPPRSSSATQPLQESISAVQQPEVPFSATQQSKESLSMTQQPQGSFSTMQHGVFRAVHQRKGSFCPKPLSSFSSNERPEKNNLGCQLTRYTVKNSCVDDGEKTVSHLGSYTPLASKCEANNLPGHGQSSVVPESQHTSSPQKPPTMSPCPVKMLAQSPRKVQNFHDRIPGRQKLPRKDTGCDNSGSGTKNNGLPPPTKQSKERQNCDTNRGNARLNKNVNILQTDIDSLPCVTGVIPKGRQPTGSQADNSEPIETVIW